MTVLLAAKDLPAEVTQPLEQLFTWLLWFVEGALVCRLLFVGARAGWEHFRPPPGPPAAPGETARVLLAWVLATLAWPIAGDLLADYAF